MKKKYPKAWEYLLKSKQLLANREHGRFRNTGWYQLYPKNLDVWEQAKILIPYMIKHLAAYYDTEDMYFVNVTTGGFGATIHSKYGDLRYFTGLLNSGLLDWFFKTVSTRFHGGYFAANKQYIEKLPIRIIDFSDRADKARHDRMVQLVERMLDLHKKLGQERAAHQKTVIQRQINATDKQIDSLVYKLYGLTKKEIQIVEKQS